MKKIFTFFLAISLAGCSSDGGSDNGIDNTELTTLSAVNVTPFSASIPVTSSREITNYNYGVLVGTSQNPSVIPATLRS